MNLYICPNYCHIKSDTGVSRCIHCGSWMLQAGPDTEENRNKLQQDAQQRQLSYKDKFSRHKIA